MLSGYTTMLEVVCRLPDPLQQYRVPNCKPGYSIRMSSYQQGWGTVWVG
jgi:hypothetical protein